MKVISKYPGIGAVILLVVSIIVASAYVFSNQGFGSGDLFAFGFWSFISALFAYPMLIVFARFSRTWPFYLAYAGAAAFGIGLAFAWTFLVKLVLGPWILAFSFPVFTCWIIGSAASFLTVAAFQNRSTWYVAPVASLVVPLAVVATLYARIPTPPPDLYVILAANLSNEQRTSAWSLFQSKPTPTPKGYNPEGFRTVSGFNVGTQEGLHVTFHPDSDSSKREEAIQKAVSSPLIYEMWEGEMNRPVRILKRVYPKAE